MLLERAAPLVFVFLWSTGWIVARAAAPYADPLTFLAVRYATAVAIIVPVLFLLRVPLPATRAAAGHAFVSGVLLHALYLGGVWWAVARGVPAGISALIAALQPLMTAALAPVLIGETVTRRQWAGIAIGLAGILLVLYPRLASLDPAFLGAAMVPLAVNVLAMVSVTLGTFYQKRFLATGDLRMTTAIQYVAGLALTLPAAWLFEEMRLEWNRETVIVLAWSVLAISFGAWAMLLLLIRRGAVSRAASLVYLVAPTAAVQAYLLFGETLTPVQIAGMAVATAGVAVVNRG